MMTSSWLLLLLLLKDAQTEALERRM